MITILKYRDVVWILVRLVVSILCTINWRIYFPSSSGRTIALSVTLYESI